MPRGEVLAPSWGTGATIGLVAFIAVKTAVNNWSMDYACAIWEKMPEGERAGWETAGHAVQSYYETGGLR